MGFFVSAGNFEISVSKKIVRNEKKIVIEDTPDYTIVILFKRVIP